MYLLLFAWCRYAAAAAAAAAAGGKSCVMKTSTRQTIFLPIPGLVPVDELIPGDLVGTNKDSYLILEKLPAEYDNRVKAMEVSAMKPDQLVALACANSI